jgi:hypothetical protein
MVGARRLPRRAPGLRHRCDMGLMATTSAKVPKRLVAIRRVAAMVIESPSPAAGANGGGLARQRCNRHQDGHGQAQRGQQEIPLAFADGLPRSSPLLPHHQ